MKRWTAIILAVVIAMNLTACNPNDLSSDDIRDAASFLNELAAEMDNSGLTSMDLADLGLAESVTTEESLGAEESIEDIIAEAEAMEEANQPVTNGEIIEDGLVTFLSKERAGAGDDFYSYVNQDRIPYEEVPAGYSSWNALYKARKNANDQITSIVADAAENVMSYDKDSPEYRLGAYYETMMDFDARNEAGMEPVMKYIDAFEDADNLDELVDADIDYLEETGISTLFALYSRVDPADSQKYTIAVTFYAGVYPGKEVITDPELEDYKNAYLVYLGEIFRNAGYDKIDAAIKGASAFSLLKGWEEHAAGADVSYDPDAYKVLSCSDFIDEYDNLPFDKYFDALDIDDECGISGIGTTESEAFSYLNDEFTEDNIDFIRNLMISQVLSLNDDVLDENMYNSYRKLTMAFEGLDEDLDRATVASNAVATVLPTDLGMIYADRYSSPEIKEEITEIINSILEAYHDQINECEWMSYETKQKAIEKLDNMQVNAVYPDEWNNMEAEAEIKAKEDGGTLFENRKSIESAYFRSDIEQAKSPVNRECWDTYPQVVNAFYDPSKNSITINASILQMGIYDENADFATNLGGIGMIIGHEISHAFDNNGAKYDAVGNAYDWWSAEDYETYQEICDKVVAVYDDFEIIPDSGKYVDGTLTLGENMADMSAMQVVERICNGDANMFREAAIAEAFMWGSKYTEETMNRSMKTDTHSPAKARVNVPIQMCDLFYDAFSVNPGDAMFIEKDNRIRIW